MKVLHRNNTSLVHRQGFAVQTGRAHLHFKGRASLRSSPSSVTPPKDAKAAPDRSENHHGAHLAHSKFTNLTDIISKSSLHHRSPHHITTKIPSKIPQTLKISGMHAPSPFTTPINTRLLQADTSKITAHTTKSKLTSLDHRENTSLQRHIHTHAHIIISSTQNLALPPKVSRHDSQGTLNISLSVAKRRHSWADASWYGTRTRLTQHLNH